MSGMTRKEAGVAHYEIEIEIGAQPQTVWTALVDDINAWWLPDFHMVGKDSVLTFDARAGGGIIESSPDGSSILWYSVQWVRPGQRTVYLVGHVAPEWGGPATTSLRLAVEAHDNGSVVRISDAHHGNIDDENLRSLREGWTSLFGDGLKRFVEDGVRRDR